MNTTSIFKKVFTVFITQLLLQSLLCQTVKTYMNPVIPGDHPDATLTRIGNDFYTAGSSFNPTPVIYHSTDLVHWEAISQPVKASWSNYGDSPGGGCWGGHLVFYKEKYWYFFARAGSMYFVKSQDPRGPWSTPEKIIDPPALPYGLGMDNSIFIDDNQKWYLLVKNGQPNNGIVELGDDGQPTGVVYNLNWINPSPTFPYSWAEGPVMWKYDSFYYYSFARDVAGGQKVMRSQSVTDNQSSWETIRDFFNENDPQKAGSLFTGPNHASPVIMLDDSTFWVIHPVYAKGEWKGQGRQGLLNQVRYNKNSYPVADYPVNKSFNSPNLPDGGIPWMVPKSDFFDSTTLNPEWSFLGYTAESTWSLTERPGWLRLSPKSAAKANTITKNDGEHNYSLITRLEYEASSVKDEAGLRIIRGDETKFVKLYSSSNSAGKMTIYFSYENIKYELPNTAGTTVWLKMERRNHKITGFFSSDGETWTQVGNSFDVSVIDSYSDFTTWAGTRQGLYVQNKAAWFDLYIYRDAYTTILANWPANQYGTIQSGGILDSIHNNDWALYAGVEFGSPDYRKETDLLLITAAGTSTGNVEVWIDSPDHGTRIGTCEIRSTGSWNTFKTFSSKVDRVKGCHDVYLKFSGASGERLFRIQTLQFTAFSSPKYLSSSTMTDSSIVVNLDKNVTDPVSPVGFQIKLNKKNIDTITNILLNPVDSAKLILFLPVKLEYTDTITISYTGGSIISKDGLELIPFTDKLVENMLPDTTFHIFLMFGQSNMEGQGTIESQDRIADPRVWMLQDLNCSNLNRSYGTWYPAVPPLNRCWGKLGPGDSFGKMLGKSAPAYVSKIGLVNASVSGCNIYIYKKGCPDGLDPNSQGIPFDCGYTWLLDLAKKAQQAGVIKGILFHQGETNNTDPAWKYTVKQIVADLKADLNLGDIPFLAGELLYSQYNSCCGSHNVEIRKLPAIIPNAHVIPAAGLPGSDFAHFTSASYRTLGERYARKMLELLYGVCDSDIITPWYRIDNGTMIQSDSVFVHTNTSLVLSPQPENLLGSWYWSGNESTQRELKINTENEGTIIETVTYTNECGSTSTIPIKIVIEKAAGAGNNSEYKEVRAYPNPANNTLIIDLSASGFTDFENAYITNALGQIVMNLNVDSPDTPFSIDISRLKAGLYTLQLTGQSRVVTKRFIKLK